MNADNDWNDPISIKPLTAADIGKIIRQQLKKIKQERDTFPEGTARWQHCQTILDLMEPHFKDLDDANTD